MTAYNQSFWAVSDPNWGNPIVIPETIRPGQMAAEEAFLTLTDYGIYTGASMFPLPEGTRGRMSDARKHGFKLVRITIDELDVEVVG
jgi:hypothetical protein